jgi:signal transduction histidine kinase
MRLRTGSGLQMGMRLNFVFTCLIVMIIGGNSLLIWQFHLTRKESEHLAAVTQEMISVLRLQTSVLAFHQSLSELTDYQDAGRLKAGSEALSRSLFNEIRLTRQALRGQGDEVEAATFLMPAMDSMELSIHTQVQSINALAGAGDWVAVKSRMSAKQTTESKVEMIVDLQNQQYAAEYAKSQSSMRIIGERIFLLVPVLAVSTFAIAVLFGWAFMRRLIELRFEARVSERARVARELHDTLLQDLSALLLRFQVGVDLLLPGEPAKAVLEDALVLADSVLVEGRNSVRDLRADRSVRADLSSELVRLAEELSELHHIAFTVATSDPARRLSAAAYDDIFSIAREALVNAFSHSKASQISLKLEYSNLGFCFSCSDDGCGLPEEIKLAGGAPGRYGLVGMRERADKLGAHLSFETTAPRGTKVTLKVPGRMAYKSNKSI